MLSPLQSKEDLLAILDSLSTAAIVFGPDLSVLYANRAAAQMAGFVTAKELISSSAKEHFGEYSYFNAEGNPFVWDEHAPVPRALRGLTTEGLVIEQRNPGKREHRWLEVTCRPFMEEGRLKQAILLYRDISDRKKKEDKLEFLVKAARLLSVQIDLTTRLEEKAKFSVPSLADWCAMDIVEEDKQLRRVALVHRDPRKIAWVEEYQRRYPPRGETAAHRVVRTGVPQFIPEVTDNMLVEMIPDKGQLKEVRSLGLCSVMVIPISSEGRVYGAMTLAYAESGRTYTKEDFTFMQEFCYHLSVIVENARLYEQISRRDKAKDMFLAALSHELRNPLAPIMNSLEILKFREVSAEAEQELGVIEHQFQHMASLLEDLLDATRFTQGKITLEKKPLEAGELVSRVVAAHRPLIERADITLSVSGMAEPVWVVGDATRLEQALTNLISNATKFTPRGGRIDVRLMTEGDEVLLCVRDSGIGMTKEDLSHIFQPYYQGTRTDAFNSGLGIGLLLVKEIARLHDGSVTAASEGPGRGSEFVLRLPRAEGEEREKPSVKAAPQHAGRRILVVDDNIAAADSLVRLLEAMEVEARAVYSGKEALAYLKTAEADLIFLDVGMPEMNGYELVAALRELGVELPIVALTGYGLEEDKQKALEAGFTSHLTKPVRMHELEGALMLACS